MKSQIGNVVLVITLAGIGAGVDSARHESTVVAQSAVDGCPETSPIVVQAGLALETFATESNSGIIYDPAGAELVLRKEGGLFQSTNFSLASEAHGLCAADFDNDGWVDVMSTSYYGSEILLTLNKTKDNQIANPPNWDDPNYVTTPKFTPGYYIADNCQGRNGHPNPPYCGGSGNEALGCADFNGDGNADFLYVRERNSRSPRGVPHNATLYLGDGAGHFSLGYEAAVASEFGYIVKSTTLIPVDYNGDGKLDLVVGGASQYKKTNKGQVLLFLNDGDAITPRFVKQTPLVSNAVMGRNGVNTLAFNDFNGDGIKDLVISGTHVRAIHMYPGLAGGGLQSSYIDITNDYPGAAAMLLGADFSLDGHTDMVLASDGYGYGSSLGGVTHYYKSNGTSLPFTAGISQILTTRGNPDTDFDMAAVFQYDNDPDATPDLIVANGNNSNSLRVFANRTLAQFTECGDVESGVLDLGGLASEEMVVTAARIAPRMTIPFSPLASGPQPVTFYMSNETPANWQLASPCPDDASAYCVSFSKPVGRDVRWKATMCSNSTRTLSPRIASVDLRFDYTVAEEHYRAGVVVDDGISYVGAFRQPGNRGHFYATNAGLSETYWDFATSLDSMSDARRNVFTSNVDGGELLAFEVGNVNSQALQATLGVASRQQAEDVIAWQRSKRFGVGNPSSFSRLGAIEGSTPAVIGPPRLPSWYPRADQATRAKVDQFISQHADRQVLALVGSRDGALHAVRSIPTNITDPANGTEAWAFVPGKIAYGMLADMTNGTSSSYPDGSPTVSDVILADGELHTVAIVSGGNGSNSVFALDITETIDENTGAVRGPDPLWDIVPGGASAGQALSKPAIARVRVNGVDRFYAIIATGVDSTNPTAPYSKGREVVAVDIATGAIAWQFQSKCAVTSDVVVFETDDELEAGAPGMDGYIDRAVWADACGYVYKVNPAQDVGRGFLSASAGSSVSTGHTDPDGNAVAALFSTSVTACAIGAERPIVGTIGARPDPSGRFALFFGTGGVESFDPTLNNDFYTVYADTGEVRGCAAGTPEKGRIQGTCVANRCEKFYGGVVVTASDVIVTRAVDAPVGTGACEYGSSEIAGFSIAELAVDFSIAAGTATVSSLYGDAGAIYFATLAGSIVRVGTPRAANAGDDTANGAGGGQAEGGASGAGGGMRLTGWRQVR